MGNKFKERTIFVKYLAGIYLNTLLNIVLNLILINKLSTYDFGKFSIGKVIFQSFEFTHIGLRNSFDRILPVKSDEQLKIRLFSIGLLLNILFSTLLAFCWFIIEGIDYVWFVLAGIIYSIVVLYKVFYRSEDKRKFVYIGIISLLCPTLFQFICFYIGGFELLLASYAIAYLIVIILILRLFPICVIIRPKKIFFTFKYMMGNGFLVYLSGLIFFISSSVDRFFISSYWGLEIVGKFSIIMFFFSVLTMFSTSYNEMIMSKIIQKKSKNFIFKHIVFLSLIIIFLCFLCYLFLPFLVGLLMPKYVEEVPLMRVILLGTIPFGAKSIINSYLHSIDKRKVLFLIEVSTTILYFALLLYILNTSDSLETIIYNKIAYFYLSVILSLSYILFYGKKKIA